jgi:hypothetical protein
MCQQAIMADSDCENCDATPTQSLIGYLDLCMSEVKFSRRNKEFLAQCGSTEAQALEHIRKHQTDKLSHYKTVGWLNSHCSPRRNAYNRIKYNDYNTFVRYKSYCGLVHAFEEKNIPKGSRLPPFRPGH